MFNIAINKDNDYGYIEIFINYLRELIQIIKDLFSSVGQATTAAPTTEESVA